MSAWNSIVVGVDGSPHSRTALKWTAAEALDHGAGLVVVNVWEHTLPPPSGSVSVSERYVPDPSQRTAEDLVEVIKEELGEDPQWWLSLASSRAIRRKCSLTSRRTPTCSWSAPAVTVASGGWCSAQ